MQQFDSGMDTFWTPRPFLDVAPDGGDSQEAPRVPAELIDFGGVAQWLERAFHKR